MTEAPGRSLFYVCPDCHAALESQEAWLACDRCGKSYPASSGIVDFSEGRYYDNFTPGQDLSPSDIEGLNGETAGALARIRDYYLPLLEGERKTIGRAPRVLDSGCGNGVSVDLLIQAGIEAWGVDLSALRKWQWGERTEPTVSRARIRYGCRSRKVSSTPSCAPGCSSTSECASSVKADTP
jgi:hypothetical protein